MAQESRKSQLIAELARCRQTISASAEGVGRGFDLAQRAKAGFARNSFAWITGASLIGFALAKLPARTKKVVIDRKGRAAQPAETAVKAGLLVSALKMGFDLARPALTKWLTQRVVSYAQQRYAPGAKR